MNRSMNTKRGKKKDGIIDLEIHNSNKKEWAWCGLASVGVGDRVCVTGCG